MSRLASVRVARMPAGAGRAGSAPAPPAFDPARGWPAVEAPSSELEREADRVAEAVTRPGGGTVAEIAGARPAARRAEAGWPQRQAASAGPPATEAVCGPPSVPGAGEPLGEAVRARFEHRFGHDFGDVRIHTGDAAAASAASLDARAYTLGRHVVFGRGRYAPGAGEGERLLAHELTHVVQQRSGRRAGVQRQADVDRVPAGLPCVVTTEPLPGPANESVQFSISSAALGPGTLAQIDRFVRSWSAGGSTARVRVDGFASVDGPQSFNWRLSCDRAVAVKDELVRRGIPEGNLVVLAHGETSSFAPHALVPNRRATITSMQPTPMTPLRGGAILATAAAPSSPLPADTVAAWRALVRVGDREGALRAVLWAMEQRGEIDPRVLAVQTGATTHVECGVPRAFILDPAVSSPLTTTCGCIGPTSRRTPNPRVRIPPDVVSNDPYVTGNPAQTTPDVLHSVLLHEYRHVIQEYERCNGSATASGICTDCNSPLEMDAYLAEMEVGYSAAGLRHAWVRVFVNWDFLSTAQQTVFRARRDAARTKIDLHLPGVDWANDPEVARYRRFCNRLGPSPPHIGTCNDTVA